MTSPQGDPSPPPNPNQLREKAWHLALFAGDGTWEMADGTPVDLRGVAAALEMAAAELDLLRERVPISVADIEQSGVTHCQLIVWAAKAGVELSLSFRGQLRPVLLIDSLGAWSAALERSPRALLAEIAAGPRQ